jgi:hypothetical protein
MRRCTRPDTQPLVSGRWMCTMRARRSTVSLNLQWLAAARQWSRDDRTHCWLDRTWPPCIRSLACPCHRARDLTCRLITGRSTTVSPVTSGDDLEPLFLDWTRQIDIDRMPHGVRSSLLKQTSQHQRTST